MKSWQQWTDLQKMIVGVVAMVAATVLLTWQILLPQQEQLAALDSRYQQAQARNQAITSFADQHTDTARYLLELDHRMNQIKMLLPDQLDIAVFLLELERIARDSKVQVSSVKPGPIVVKNGYRDLPMDVQIKGSYFPLLDFLRRVEAATRFVGIDKTVIQSQNGVLTTKLVIHIYGFGTGGLETNATTAIKN